MPQGSDRLGTDSRGGPCFPSRHLRYLCTHVVVVRVYLGTVCCTLHVCAEPGGGTRWAALEVRELPCRPFTGWSPPALLPGPRKSTLSRVSVFLPKIIHAPGQPNTPINGRDRRWHPGCRPIGRTLAVLWRPGRPHAPLFSSPVISRGAAGPQTGCSAVVPQPTSLQTPVFPLSTGNLDMCVPFFHDTTSLPKRPFLPAPPPVPRRVSCRWHDHSLVPGGRTIPRPPLAGCLDPVARRHAVVRRPGGPLWRHSRYAYSCELISHGMTCGIA